MKLRWLASLAILSICACSGTSTMLPLERDSKMARYDSGAASYRVAPYIDMGAWPPPRVSSYVTQTGTLYYTLGFIQSYKSKLCEGAWGGTVLPSASAYYARQLAAIRAAGGDGIVSFFGNSTRNDLASVCPNPEALAKAIEGIVDLYHLTRIDFDIEGAQPYDARATARRSAALRLVIQHYGGSLPVVSYTLPVNPNGLPSPDLALVSSALKAKVTLSIVNIMTMDYGDAVAPNPRGKMGSYAIQAAQSTAAQLKRIGFPFGANAYSSIGITPMIGQNGVADEVFEPSDASQLVAWAATAGVGRLSFWAQQRDKACPGGVNSHASDTCSGIVQTTYAFAKLFAAL